MNAHESLERAIRLSLRFNLGQLPDQARMYAAQLASRVGSRLDWRVLGGVIPGTIPVEWVRLGDTIQDHGVTGTITRIVPNGRMRHVYIDSGHVCFAKVAQQDFITVFSTNHETGGL